MTSSRSSSNRTAIVCDAVILSQQRAVGPIRLPASRADDFIAHFNRTYQGVGIKLAPIKPQADQQAAAATDSTKKIPGSSKAAGDDDSG